MLFSLSCASRHASQTPDGKTGAREFGSNSLDLSRRILEDAGVAVMSGIDFGDGAEGYLRFSYASDLEAIREGLDRIEKYLTQ